MEFHLESPVVSGDGAEMGKIKRVIFDPRSNEVKSVIVEKGVFFAHDVAVPIEDIRAAEPGRVELSIGRDEFGKLPEFFEADYTWPDANWSAPSGWRSGAVMWPLGWYPNGAGFERPDTTSEIVHRAQEQDMQNAVIGQGSEVLAKGGEKVGEVHNLQIDPSSQKPTSMSLRRGFLFTEDVEIPSAWIESYDDGTVQLNVDKSIVEQLAETKQAVHSEPRG